MNKVQQVLSSDDSTSCRNNDNNYRKLLNHVFNEDPPTIPILLDSTIPSRQNNPYTILYEHPNYQERGGIFRKNGVGTQLHHSF